MEQNTTHHLHNLPFFQHHHRLHTMECGTIAELGSSLATRFETAKTAFRLHISAGRDAEELAEMMASLVEIQRDLKELRTTAEQERQHLEYAKVAGVERR